MQVLHTGLHGKKEISEEEKTSQEKSGQEETGEEKASEEETTALCRQDQGGQEM